VTSLLTPTHSARKPPLRIRLTLWIVLISVIIQITLGLVLLLFQHRAVDAMVAEELAERVGLLRTVTAANDSPIDDAFLGSQTDIVLRSAIFDHVTAALIDANNVVLASSTRPATLPPIPALKSSGFQRLSESVFPATVSYQIPSLLFNEPVRLANGSEARLIVLSPDRYAASLASLAGRVALVALTLGTLATAIAAWLMSGLAVAHLRELPAMAGSLAPDRLERTDQPSVSRELSEFQTALVQTRTRLKVALSAQERFISNASHELKTPIAVLLTEAQTIDRAALNEDGKAFVQSVVDEMRRLGQMLEGFLMLTKLRGGKTSGKQSQVALHETLLDAISSAKMAALRGNVSIETSLLESTDPLILGNPDLLHAMLENLVRNGIRFSPRGSRLEIRTLHEGPQIAVSFHDRGPNVPQESLGRLFDRFDEPGESRSKGRHNSVALSIALGIAELHGGSISVDAPPEGGCRFSVTLPIETPPDPDPRTATF